METKLYTEKYSDLKTESDRAVILISCTIIDTQLQDLLNAYFNQKAKKIKIKENEIYENNAPFSSFSSKIKMAYLIGLIPEFIYSDLEIIRKLRNKAAHEICDISFTEKRVEDTVESLVCVKNYAAIILEKKDSKNGISIKFDDKAKLDAFCINNEVLMYHKALYIISFQVLYSFLDTIINTIKDMNIKYKIEKGNIMSNITEIKKMTEIFANEILKEKDF